MRELFETIQPENPVAAARRGARPALRRRTYENATAATMAAGHVVCIDHKPVRTPARRVLAGPTLALAQAIAAEWTAQREVIDPAKMPLTRLANAIVDGVTDSPGPIAADIEKYLASDLLFYRASGPVELRERQAQHWDPILVWTRDALGADFKLGEDVVHVTQPLAALAAAGAAIPDEPRRLGAVHAATTLTGSALLALALACGLLATDAAWQSAHIDEDWNMERWGRDDIALERRALRFTEFQAAAIILASLQQS
jgi:chaperone required for assembly of F1-ATPase